MELDNENPTPLGRLPGSEGEAWQNFAVEADTAYLQQLAGVERLEEATSLQLVVNSAAGGSIAHLGCTLPNLLELNLNGSALDSLRDLGTGFSLLQVLWVSRCGLTALDGLNGLPALRELYAAYNDIADLQPVEACQHLEVLDLECNCIPDTDAVYYLTQCTSLQTLTLTGNPAAEQPQYRGAVCSMLPSLISLDDEPVADPGEEQADQPDSRPQHAELPSSSPGAKAAGQASGTKPPLPPGPPIAPAPFAAAAAAVSAAYTSNLLGSSSPRTAKATAEPSGVDAVLAQTPTGPAAAPGPREAEEVALVIAGIKHARVGVDSQEFREIEMSMLVATADGADMPLDARPGTSALMPMNASTWMRTLRSSREGALAAVRASHQAAAGTGSRSPSACSASPSSSRPGSSQQQRTSNQHSSAPQDRWALPVSHSFGASGTGSNGAHPGGKRPSSGAGASPGMGMGGPERPGSGGYRPSTCNRPFSARPGTASMRLGTSASTGAAPSAAAGLYWAKNRLGSGGGGGEGGGVGGGGQGGGAPGAGALLEVNLDDGSSRLTQGTESSFGGSLAKDLRKWKGAAVRAGSGGLPVGGGGGRGGSAGGAASGDAGPSAATSGPGAAAGGARAANGGVGSVGGGGNGTAAAAALGGGTGLSLTLLRGGQLDPKALLEELKRWKVETADKVLLPDPDGEGAPGQSGSAWGNGGEDGGHDAGRRADILQLGDGPDTPGLERLSLEHGLHGPEPALSPGVPGSPMKHPVAPPQRGTRKMVLSKVIRDTFTDSVGSSGASLGEVLAQRPVHVPPGAHARGQHAHGGEGGSRLSAGDHQVQLDSRPGSREEGAALAAAAAGPRSGSRGAAQGQYRVTSIAGEFDVRSANPQPVVRKEPDDS